MLNNNKQNKYLNMYYLGYTEYYNSYIHGNNELDGALLVYNMIDKEDFYDISEGEIEGTWLYNLFQRNLSHLDPGNRGFKHKTIRNYNKLIKNKKSFNLKILDIYINNLEYTAIDKTYLLRILQRKIKKWLDHKREINSIRKNPRELMYRSVYGKWNKRAMYKSI